MFDSEENIRRRGKITLLATSGGSDGAAACSEALATSGLESATSVGSGGAAACIEALAAPGLESATLGGSDGAAACLLKIFVCKE